MSGGNRNRSITWDDAPFPFSPIPEPPLSLPSRPRPEVPARGPGWAHELSMYYSLARSGVTRGSDPGPWTSSRIEDRGLGLMTMAPAQVRIHFLYIII